MSYWKKFALISALVLVPTGALAAYRLAAPAGGCPMNAACKCGADCRCGADCKCKDGCKCEGDCKCTGGCKCGDGADHPHHS